MSRYYFHVKRGQVTVLDQEGLERAWAARRNIDEGGESAVGEEQRPSICSSSISTR